MGSVASRREKERRGFFQKTVAAPSTKKESGNLLSGKFTPKLVRNGDARLRIRIALRDAT
jgi:hypothetical protein